MRASESAAESVAEREVVITRVFDAPARLLFEAYNNLSDVVAKMRAKEIW